MDNAKNGLQTTYLLYILAILYTSTVFHQHQIEQLFWV